MSPSLATPTRSEPDTDAARVAGSLEQIWIKRVRLGPMDAREEARAVADRGLVGNADQGGKRQVTVLAAEAWDDAVAEVGQWVAPTERRANLLVRGVALEGSRGRVLRVGALRLEIVGETRPCRRMDEACQGLKDALGRRWRGGVYGRVLADATIRVGDPVRWED